MGELLRDSEDSWKLRCVSTLNGFLFTIVLLFFELLRELEFLALTGLLPLRSSTPRSFLGLTDGKLSPAYRFIPPESFLNLRPDAGERHGFMRTICESSEEKLGSYTKFLWLSLFGGLLECKRPLSCNASRICFRDSKSLDCSSSPLNFKFLSEIPYIGAVVCFGSGKKSAESKKLLRC